MYPRVQAGFYDDGAKACPPVSLYCAPAHEAQSDGAPAMGDRKQDTTFYERYGSLFSFALKATLIVGATLEALSGQWLPAAVSAGIALVMLTPLMLGKRFGVRIPPEFELLAVIFVYASLYLGEVQGYYQRFWWWDIALHGASGLLLGILGFLLVYVINEHEDLELHMKPAFTALFAFMFAVGMGALWEIFEFGMDRLFGMNMQRASLVDTMSDLIVDSISALVIALLGYSYLSNPQETSFLERGVQRFIRANERLFRRPGA